MYIVLKKCEISKNKKIKKLSHYIFKIQSMFKYRQFIMRNIFFIFKPRSIDSLSFSL